MRADEVESADEGDRPLTASELLTLQFYQWEHRGRGWQLWDHAVELEPPFRPFLFHDVPTPTPGDDARKETFLSSLVSRILGKEPAAVRASGPAEDEADEPEPVLLRDASPVVEVQISVPPTLKVGLEAATRLLICLPDGHRPIAFEVLGEPGQILLQFACRGEDLPALREQLHAHFPEAVLAEHEGYLAEAWDRTGERKSLVVDFGFSQEFMLPLQVARGFDVDPLTAIVGALANLEVSEVGLLQILFVPCRNPWAANILRAVSDGDGSSFFADAPNVLPLAKEKVARPLFAAVVRVAAQSPSSRRLAEITRALGGALRQFSTPPGNEFIPLENDGYADEGHLEDLLLRRSRRSGMIVNSDELVSLVHLPSVSVRSDKLKRETRKTKAAPASAVGHAFVLGENTHAGVTRPVALSPEDRSRHTYVVGASGTGKSTLLLNCIVQDLRHGEGIAVLDPHGDLIDDVLRFVPEERIDDVVLLDPADAEFPIGFNILSAHSEIEKNLLASDLVAVFRRLSTSWGDQMTSVLGNAVLAFLESTEGGTLVDLRRFLIEPEFRRAFLPTVQDREVVYFWEREFPLLAGRPQAPLLTRLDTFLRPKLIRHMVAQKENRLDFAKMMDEGKILLAKLAQGAIGEENAYLLGTLLVSKFHQIALSRQAQQAAARRPFYLYIDEFHNFITPSMAQILTGARKYRLGLTLAHQDLRQVGARDAEIGGALQSLHTRICFRVGEQDAKRLEEGFSTFTAADLQNLGTGEAIGRIERAEFDFNLRTLPRPEVERAAAEARREAVVARSRERSATPRATVEAILGHTVGQAAAPAACERPPDESPPRRRTAAPPAAPPTVERAASTPPAPSPGRGGPRHKYLQQLIKRWAESRGWHATIEKPILDGLGSVDVVLEREQRSVACEISVTSTPEHELRNVQKCLAAGFEHVTVVSNDSKALRSVRESVLSRLEAKDAGRVHFLTLEELFPFVEGLEVPAAATERTVKGYRVRTEYAPVGQGEKKNRRQAVSRVILRALRRLKDTRRT